MKYRFQVLKKYLSSVTIFLLLVTGCRLLVAGIPVFAEPLKNPLGDANSSIPIIIGNVIRAALGLAGSLALLIFIWGGFMWITAHGDEKQVKNGWDTLLWGTFGMVVIFSSYIIANYVLGLFGLG